MQRQVNFSELKQNVSIEDVLEHYGLLEGLRRVKDDELVGLCPFPAKATIPFKSRRT